MPAVENGVIPAETIPPVDVAQGINQPQVIELVLILDHYVNAFCPSRFHDKVFALALWHIGKFVGVREQFVAVGVGELGEPLGIGFDVHVDPLCQVVLETSHSVGSGLQAVPDLLNVAVRPDQLILKIGWAGQKAVKQVDHIAVRVCRDQVLAVQTSCGLQTQTL